MTQVLWQPQTLSLKENEYRANMVDHGTDAQGDRKAKNCNSKMSMKVLPTRKGNMIGCCITFMGLALVLNLENAAYLNIHTLLPAYAFSSSKNFLDQIKIYKYVFILIMIYIYV